MFKMFAILCVLVWPDDVMTSELKCTTHYEDPPRQFVTMQECDEAAYDKLVFTINVFEQTKTDYKTIQTGFKKIDKAQ